MMTPIPTSTRVTRPLRVPVDVGMLAGDLSVPRHAQGFVIFAHGSGSSRFSPRNRYVADALDHRDLATLLIDLLTESEEAADARTGHLRFNITLLARRLLAIADWSQGVPELRPLPVGLFGASTGAAGALLVAAERPQLVRAVVSRGGRPDLAVEALERVKAPTLLIVGGLDDQVIELNRIALMKMTGVAQLEIIPGATHLFEEPGTLEAAADLAGEWFDRHLKNVA